jgi:peptidyl-prolyl cis-trans isomerase C
MKQSVFWAMPLVLALGACHHRAEGQAVAVVNGEEVTSSELNAELQGANLPANMGTDEARSKVLQSLIDRRLLTQQARADGLDETPEFLNKQRQLSDNLLINMLVSRQLNTKPLPSAEEIAQFEAGRPEMFDKHEFWQLDQVQFPTPKDPATMAKLNATHSLDDIAKIIGATGGQVTRTKARIETSIFPHDLYTKVAGLPNGEPFIFRADERSVASVVVGREAAPLTGVQARAAALNAIRREQAAKILQDKLKSARSAAKIQYQPGFTPKN